MEAPDFDLILPFSLEGASCCFGDGSFGVILEVLLRDFQSGRLSITVAATSDASSPRGGVDGEIIFASLAPGITSKFEAVCGGIAGGSLCALLLSGLLFLHQFLDDS